MGKQGDPSLPLNAVLLRHLRRPLGGVFISSISPSDQVKLGDTGV